MYVCVFIESFIHHFFLTARFFTVGIGIGIYSYQFLLYFSYIIKVELDIPLALYKIQRRILSIENNKRKKK